MPYSLHSLTAAANYSRALSDCIIRQSEDSGHLVRWDIYVNILSTKHKVHNKKWHMQSDEKKYLSAKRKLWGCTDKRCVTASSGVRQLPASSAFDCHCLTNWGSHQFWRQFFNIIPLLVPFRRPIHPASNYETSDIAHESQITIGINKQPYGSTHNKARTTIFFVEARITDRRNFGIFCTCFGWNITI